MSINLQRKNKLLLKLLWHRNNQKSHHSAAPVDDFNTPIRRGNDYAVRYKGKVYNLDAFNMLHPDLAIRADNDTLDNASQCGFGDRFPDAPLKGDMWITYRLST